MVQQARTFRIFVSSTFSDLKEERNALQQYVFPRLRELCLQHGTRFQAIDLRWGVSEEAGIDQQTMNICLGEIERCRKVSPRPNFIVLLGDRYGWRPLPPQIRASEFEQILEKVSLEERQLLLWQDDQPEGQKGWYRRDDNAVPPEYILQPRTGEYEDHDRWSAVEQKLHAILSKAITGLSLELYDRLKYEASATEQEIWAGALRVEDAKEHVGCFFRSLHTRKDDGLMVPIHDSVPDANMRDFVDLAENGSYNRDAFERLKGLKRRLNDLLPGRVHEYQAEWQWSGTSLNHIGSLPEKLEDCLALNKEMEASHGLCVDVWRWLSRLILQEAQALQQTEPLHAEIKAHEDFGQERARHFVGRSDILNEIADYLAGTDNHPLVIFGESGSGKSALMAKAAEKARQEHPQAEIVVRLIGATPSSSDGRALLESLCRQIPRSYGTGESAVPSELKKLMPEIAKYLAAANAQGPLEESTVPTDYKDLVPELARRLALATDQRPLIVFLDALDQLSGTDNARNLAWLPRELPDHVRFVVSALEREDEAGECLKALHRQLPARSFLQLKPLGTADADELLGTWLREAGRRLQPPQRQEIIAKFVGCPLPLYLKLAFEEARRWHSYDDVPQDAHGRMALGRDIPMVIRDLLWRLSRESSHGEMLVSRALGYLGATRHGLAENELLDVLSRDVAVYSRFLKRSHHIPSDLQSAAKRYLQASQSKTIAADNGDQSGEAAAVEWLRGIREDTGQLSGFLEWALPQADGPRLPVVLWSRLSLDLAPYLTERDADGASLLGFYHRQFQEAVAEQYLAGPEQRDRHTGLAEYFSGQPLWIESNGNRQSNARKVAELPYQQTGAQQWPELEATLTSLEFVEAKCDAEMAYGLVEDYKRLVLGRTRPGPPIRTAWRHQMRCGIQCPYCLSWFAVEEPELGGNIHCHSCGENLQLNPFVIQAEWHPLARADGRVRWKASDQTMSKAPLSSAASDFADFVRAQVHVLASFPQLTLQQALNWPADTAPARAGMARWETETVGQCLVRWINKPKRCGAEIITFQGHEGDVYACAYSPDGSRIVSTSKDKTLKIWDAESGAEVATLRGHVNNVSACAYSPDGLRIVSASWDDTLKIWDAESGVEIATLRGHVMGVLDCAYSPDGRRIVSSSFDRTLKVWDAESGTEIGTLKGHADTVNACAYSPSGRRIVSAAWDKTLKIWDAESGVEVATLRGHTDNVWHCAFSPDGLRIISTSKDRTLKIWDAESGTEISPVRGFANGTVTCAYSPDGRHIVLASNDRTLKVYDLTSGAEIATLEGHGDPLSACAYSPDGRRIVSASIDSTLKLWDVESGTEMGTIQRHADDVCGCSYSPDGRHIASASRDKTLKVWNPGTAMEMATLKGHTCPVYGCTFSPDGQRITSTSSDETLKLWDAVTGTEIATVKGHVDSVYVCAYSPDGRQIVSGSDDKTLKVWDAESGVEIATLKGHAYGIYGCSYSPDGRRIASASVDRTLKVWDSATAMEVATLKGHDGPLSACSYSPDGLRIVSGSTDYTLKVWDAESGANLITIRGHTDRVITCKYFPDGRRIASGSDDKTLRIWDAESGAHLATYHAGAGVRAIAFSPDGTYLAAGVRGGWVHILRLEGFPPYPPIATAWIHTTHWWRPWGRREGRSSAFGCPHCHRWSEIPEAALGTELPCPNCGKSVRLNPFTIDADWRPIAKAWRGR